MFRSPLRKSRNSILRQFGVAQIVETNRALLDEVRLLRKPIAVDYDERSFEYARSRDLEIMTPDEFPQRIPDESVDAIRFSHVLARTPRRRGGPRGAGARRAGQLPVLQR